MMKKNSKQSEEAYLKQLARNTIYFGIFAAFLWIAPYAVEKVENARFVLYF